MAGSTTAFQRGVHYFFLDLGLHVDVAGEAQISALFNEQARILRLMRIMARRAVARGSGTMDEFVVYLVRMA